MPVCPAEPLSSRRSRSGVGVARRVAALRDRQRLVEGRVAERSAIATGVVAVGVVGLTSEARRFTRDGRFVTLYGQEFSSIGSGNHANVLEVGEVTGTNVVPNGR